MLPTRELLLGASYPNSLAAVLKLAAISLRTYQPQWSGFLTAPEQEECLNRLNQLIELTVISNGGFPQAERRRLRLERSENSTSDPASKQQTPQELPEQMPPAEQFKLLEISGNFLFDPAEAIDFRQALQADGLGDAELGDVLVRGDRGALAVVSPLAAIALIGKPIQVRTVLCSVAQTGWERLPSQMPTPKQITSVEASLRLDAVASAGFAISRNRMAELIRSGKVRIDWKVITNPSRELKPEERVQLEGRGELKLESAMLTKRDRWRLSMLRNF
jgi:photosystem II S4 domain protein